MDWLAGNPQKSWHFDVRGTSPLGDASKINSLNRHYRQSGGNVHYTANKWMQGASLVARDPKKIAIALYGHLRAIQDHLVGNN